MPPESYESRLLQAPASFADAALWAAPAAPDHWRVEYAGFWTAHISPEPTESWGWKVHVSSTLADAPEVLRRVLLIGHRRRLSLKYIATEEAFLALHFKGASRLQSGKFIALYPPSAAAARELMRELSTSLAGFEGPPVLTDRSFDGSPNVHYRWGSFLATQRRNDDGDLEDLIGDGSGNLVPDVRLPRFTAPGGIADPFNDAPTGYSRPDAVLLNRYSVVGAVRYTSGGGIYSAVVQATGQPVIIKEARPHTGYVGKTPAPERLEAEVRWLRWAHALKPSLAPAVIDTFQSGTHSFVVLEHIPGVPLQDWIAQQCPLYSSGFRSTDRVRRYFQRCAAILRSLREDLDILHAHGVAFGDLSPSNVIVDEHDVPRLVDFEACTASTSRAASIGTPDYCLLATRDALVALERDEYAFHALGLAFVVRLTSSAEVGAHVLGRLAQELQQSGHELPPWWARCRIALDDVVVRHSAVRRPDAVPPDTSSKEGLRALRAGLATALLDSITIGDGSLFPASRRAVQGPDLGFSSGDAGILVALHGSGIPIPTDAREQFEQQAHRALERRDLPAGYAHGLAGIADACLTLGMGELAARALDELVRQLSSVEGATLDKGVPGAALVLQRAGRVEEAKTALRETLRRSESLSWPKNGLTRGRAGVVAAACLVLPSSEPGWQEPVQRLLAAECAQIYTDEHGHRSLRAEPERLRLLPYIEDGTAGLLVTMAVARSSGFIDVPVSDASVLALAADLETPFTLEGTLLAGVSGLTLAHSVVRHAWPHLAPQLPALSHLRVEKYIVPLGNGYGVLDPRTRKFDLSFDRGSAGILASLNWHDCGSPLSLSGIHLPGPGGEAISEARRVAVSVAARE